MRVIGDIARLGAKRYPTRAAVIMEDRRVDFATLDTSSGAIASALGRGGVGAGDRVAILAENCIEFVEVAFAVAKSGATFVPLNFRYGPQELDYVLADVSPSVVFAGAGYMAAVEESLRRTGLTSQVVALHEDAPLTLSSMREESASELPYVDPQSTATILYTSGTTGRPKGVMASHEATIRLLPMYGTEGGLTGDDVMLVCMPLFHGGGLVIQALSALFFGATIVLFGKGFAPSKVLDVVRKQSVTITLWTPTMLAMLTRSEEITPSRVRTIWYGSSSITENVLADATRMFPDASFYQWYGTTEATSLAVLRPEHHPDRPRATGREIVLADLRIVDEDGVDVAPGEVGEIVVAAHGTVMQGYYNNPEATAATIRDGWLHTGDHAVADPEGFFTIVGRSSDLIVTGGENVYPGEIEEVLTEHPEVVDVAVFGLPDEVYGEVVAAAVVVKAPVEHDELRESVAARLSRYKIPRVIRTVDTLPRNASGKVLRRDLVASFTEDRQADR